MQDSQQKSQRSQKSQIPLIDQIKNQMLKAWQPVPSLTKTIIIFLILGLIFLGIGLPMKIFSNYIQQYKVRYDQHCGQQIQCNVTISISMQMTHPIFFYYQLQGYYQNHRLYASSISTTQMMGKNITESTASSNCQPIIYNKNLYVNMSINNQPLSPNQIANPCGLIAYTYFNDSFAIGNDSNNFTINNEGIAWPSDKYRFKIQNASTMWINITDQRFMNWVRISSISDFRKLWGRIQTTLSSGEYLITISNNYHISQLGTKKYIILSQSNFFGSKNNFLSITYLTTGTISFIIAFIFLIIKIYRNKNKK